MPRDTYGNDHDTLGSDKVVTASNIASYTGGAELGYAELTSNWTLAMTANQISNVTGLALTVTVSTRPINIEVFVPSALSSVISSDVSIQLYEDGNIIQASTITPSANNKGQTGYLVSRRIPTAGIHSYQVKIKSQGAATVTLLANAQYPTFIQAIER